MKVNSFRICRKFALPNYENFDSDLISEVSELDDLNKVFDLLNNKILEMANKIKAEKIKNKNLVWKKALIFFKLCLSL